MNYYEHHIGDFLKKTVHLTAVEEGIYRRLLDRYYTTEQPLPADVRECCKLARAATKAERDAVRDVLRDFFTLEADGHHQGRADQEIARFQEKSAKAKRSAEARWNAQRPQSECNANAYANASDEHMRTHCEGNATRARPQSPITNHQIQNTEHTPSTADGARAQGLTVEPTTAGATCKAMRAKGVSDTNPGDPRLLALLAQGATLAEFEGLAEEAVRKGIGKPFGWVLTVLPARREQAASLALAPQIAAQAAPTETAYQRSMRERIEAFAPEIAAKVPGRSPLKPAAVIESETTLLEGPQ